VFKTVIFSQSVAYLLQFSSIIVVLNKMAILERYLMFF